MCLFLFMNKVFGIVPIIMKVLLGLVFIASAILKVVDMDQFEIYVYSYHFFNLNTSFVVARVAVIIELVLGIGLASNTLHKLYWWGSMAMLVGYTLLLLYALHMGRTDNCHCFGDFLQFDPKQSLVKNGILILLFLPLYWMGEWETPFRWLILCLAIIGSSIAVFAVSPPDNYTDAYTAEQNLQMELFDEMLDEAPLDSLNLRDGKQIVCFFSSGCEFCQLSAQILSLMQKFNDFPADKVTYLFMGTEEGIDKFYEKSESVQYRNMLYPDVVRMLTAINGEFPTIVFMDNGVVTHVYGLRNMKEDEIKAFMAL